MVYFRGEEWRSQGNRDTTPYTTTFDHNIQSMAQGMTPVLRAGEHLRRVMNSDNCSPDWRVQLYVSPYVHTRLMFHKLRRRFLKKRIIGVREESQVRELDFGNFMIKWPNSLKTFPSGVANCRNLHFGVGATCDSRDACSTKGIRAESPPTFI